MSLSLGNKVKNPVEPVSMSDRSGRLYNTFDMVKQMEYMGNNLTWTGLMVGSDEMDIPNENLKIFKPPLNEGVPPPNTRPYIVEGVSPPFYGPEMNYTETLKQLMDFFSNDDI